MTRAQLVDRHFLELRAWVLDLAAGLDRLDRAPGSAPGSAPDSAPGSAPDSAPGSSRADYREVALRKALAILTDGQPDRTRRILESLSDPTPEPIEKAPTRAATGAYPP